MTFGEWIESDTKSLNIEINNYLIYIKIKNFCWPKGGKFCCLQIIFLKATNWENNWKIMSHIYGINKFGIKFTKKWQQPNRKMDKKANINFTEEPQINWNISTYIKFWKNEN